MVNVIIYLDKLNQAETLVHTLLSEGLVASASIDADNAYYMTENGEVITNVHTVITAQTKSMLFTKIVKKVDELIGHGTPVFSLPITQANDFFDNYIRERTLKI